MVTWGLVYSKRAQKDAKKIAASNLKSQAQRLLDAVKLNPFGNPPPFEKLVGDMRGLYSRRINLQHRMVYEIVPDKNIVMVHSMFTHYEG